MKKCPFCAEMIEEETVQCPYCSEKLIIEEGESAGADMWGYEYKSKKRWFGLPLVHIARGIDPQTGHSRKAKGIIAIGNTAIGVIAIGGKAFGIIPIGGFSAGLLAFGGVSLGVVSFGVLALAAFLAIGGIAASPFYAIGALAFARNPIGFNQVDQWFLRQVEKVWTVIGPRDPVPTPKQ